MSEPTKVYIAGPMRRVAEFNFPAFDDAARRLRAAGYEAFSPAERDRAVGFNETRLTGHEDLEALGFDHAEAMRADLQWIVTEADAVALLPGWLDSRGARTEAAAAQAIGLAVWEFYPVHGDATGFVRMDVTESVFPRSGKRQVTIDRPADRGEGAPSSGDASVDGSGDARLDRRPGVRSPHAPSPHFAGDIEAVADEIRAKHAELVHQWVGDDLALPPMVHYLAAWNTRLRRIAAGIREVLP